MLADELNDIKTVPVVSPDGTSLLELHDVTPDFDIVTLDL